MLMNHAIQRGRSSACRSSGKQHFPKHHTYRIGRNDADRAPEIAATEDRSQPLPFTKPANAIEVESALHAAIAGIEGRDLPQSRLFTTARAALAGDGPFPSASAARPGAAQSPLSRESPP